MAEREIAEAVLRDSAEGRRGVLGRTVEVKGFSTLPRDEMVVIYGDGRAEGELLARRGADRLDQAAGELLAGDGFGLRTVAIEIRGRDVAEMGLACGGRADVLLQPVAAIPPQLWTLLSSRSPAALLTRVEGEGAGEEIAVVDRQGHSWGFAGVGAELVGEAVALLAGGRSDVRRLEDQRGVVLIEAWVPAPRLVVVGSGEMATALHAQAGLLGWETRSTDSPAQVAEMLEWAGASGALIVLSHDPHVDAPALSAGLASGVSYVGAMGSRSTQSRRVDRLAELGVDPADVDRIHRPIGLNLGGRRAPEVALAIVAEVLACHNNRDARSLRDTTGPIHAAAG